MPSVAEQLRHAREAQRLSLEQVAEATKMKADHIIALEAGDYHVFSAPVYIRGFVRMYSNILKLNVPQVLSDLDEELARTEKFSEPPDLVEHPKTILDGFMFYFSKVKWKFVIPLGLALIVIASAVLGLSYWYTRNPSDPLKQVGPGLYQVPSQMRGEFLPLPTNSVRR